MPGPKQLVIVAIIILGNAVSRLAVASLESQSRLASVGSAGASASGAIIPISGPVRITENGYYLLSGDFTISSGNGIEIGGRNVTLDLGGHTITNLGVGTAVKALGTTPGSYSIRVTHGSIRGGGYGVFIFLTPPDGMVRTEVDHLDIVMDSGNGIVVAGGNGITVAESTLVHNNAVSGGGIGIAVDSIESGEVRENLVQGSKSGMYLTGGSEYEPIPAIRENMVTQCIFGIEMIKTVNAVIEANRATSNSYAGFHFEDFFMSSVTRNESSNNSLDGFTAYDVMSNFFESNVTSDNGRDGMKLDGSGVSGNVISNNVSTRNADCGINVGFNYNTLYGNKLSDNGADLCIPPPPH